MIRVLVVEDSRTCQEYLAYLLSCDPEIEVVGTASSGSEAIEFLGHCTPDVVTMDIRMPGMDGIQTTRRIMETRPLPIVIVSAAINPSDVETSFRALEAGAIAVVEKPWGIGHFQEQPMAKMLVQTVKNMAGVKVIKRWPKPQRDANSPNHCTAAAEIIEPGAVKLVAIGTSTGGPPVLKTILSRLPHDFQAPIIIVQHIAPGFLPGLAAWLQDVTGFPVHIGTEGETPRPGCALLAPDGMKMGIDRHGRIALAHGKLEEGLCPSVSHLFGSVATVYGASAIGILLTGMGKDGAAELKTLRETGAITIAQDQESSAVHGMPGEAIRLNAATLVLSPEKIADILAQLVKSRAYECEGE